MSAKINPAENTAMRVSVISIIVNFALSVFKLIAGVIASSGAMISDAIHSASDVFSTLIVIVGVKISYKASDPEHPYGHERMECVAAIVLSVVLVFAGAGIGWSGFEKIIGGNYAQLEAPGILALIAAIVSIATKEWMYHYTRISAKKIKSDALMADAWHHRSDALSSIGAFVGILGARLGYPIMDPIASLLICVMIVWAAIKIFKSAVDKMVDKSCDGETKTALEKLVLAQEGVIRIDDIKVRMFGNRIYVDVEIAADGDKLLHETHAIAESIHEKIETEFSDVKHIMVHVNPA